MCGILHIKYINNNRGVQYEITKQINITIILHVEHVIVNKRLKSFKPSRCIKEYFYVPYLIFLQLSGFRRKNSMKLFYQHMLNWQFIFFNCSLTSKFNSRLAVGEDDNGKFRLIRV